MVNMFMRRCSASLVIRETQIKITMRYYLIPTKVGIIKKRLQRVGKDVKKLEPTCDAGGYVK